MVDYVRVTELTKRGYPHVHVFFTEYLDWSTIQRLWLSAVNSVFHTDGKHGHANIKHSYSALGAALYVSKYVLKSALDPRFEFRLWSKSNGASIFEHHESSGEWHFLNARYKELNLSLISVTSQVLADFLKICSESDESDCTDSEKALNWTRLYRSQILENSS